MASADALSFAMIFHSLMGISSCEYPCFSRDLWCSVSRVAKRWLVMRCSRRISSNKSIFSMGRSFNGLVTFTRMDASPYLSSVKARLSGGSRRCETGSGSCAFCFQTAKSRFYDSVFKAAHQCNQAIYLQTQMPSKTSGEATCPGADQWAALNFDSTYSSGAAVESTPAALLYAVGKEM